MLAKLAVRNVRRSVRDYAIYFVTLVFGVAVFYAFNSVQSQSVLFDLKGSSSESFFTLTGQVLGMFSVVIACVLGFLVVYANRFLIKRRKQEFGTYVLLGMKPGQVSAVVLMETVCVGAVSLAVGLAVGVALSQGLSFFTAGLFNIPMQQYRFVFSNDAFLQTLGCFAVIYAVVALFNTVSIRRYKLIDLLGARNRNERFRVRNPWVSAAAFVVSVALLALAYKKLADNGLVMFFDADFNWATGLMLAGTFLFFWSAAGFALLLIERTRGVYFKGLAMFTMRQIASKVNTAFMSLSVVCVMLFLSLTVFSTGTGMVRVFTGNVDEGTLFDASLTANVYLNAGGTHDPEALASMTEEDRAYQDVADAKAAAIRADAEDFGWSIADKLRASAPNWDDFVESTAQVDAYQPEGGTDTYGEVMDRVGAQLTNQKQNDTIRPQNLVIVSESQFNAVRALCGRDPVYVGESGYAVDNTVDLADDLSRALAKEGTKVTVAGRELSATGELVSQPLVTTPIITDAGVLVVPDAVVDAARAAGETPTLCYLDIQYKVDREEGDRLLDEALAAALPVDDQAAANGYSYKMSPWPVTVTTTAADVVAQSGGLRMLITYLALYIGFVFLITTAAMLAIQQLSEASDSLPRYKVLAQIGCDRRMILGSLRTQVLVYFLAPLALAVCHTACAVSILSDQLFAQLGVSVLESVMLTAVLTVAVYGTYLVLTYLASRGIVRASLGKKLLG